MTPRISLGCALLAILLGACQQTLMLDDLSADASRSATGGKSGSGGGSGGGKQTDASIDGNCGLGQQIIATGDIPQVVVALDRSSEMLGTQFGKGQNDSQFNVAVSDLSAQVGNYSYSPSGQHSSRRAISFAYLEFPESATDCGYPGCCSSEVTPTASYQAFTDATMLCSLLGNACGSSSNHPIAAALSRAQDYFQPGTFSVQSEERYVLLVTDDAPDGNCSTENDCQFAQDKVYSLANSLNVTTVIIHVGPGGSTSCLQDFATTQGAPPPWYAGNNLYYAAPMPDDLQNAVATAIAAIAAGTCRFTLSTTPGSLSQLAVLSQGTTLPQDSKNGWTYDGGTGAPRLILHGNACTSYLNSNSTFGLQVYQGCAPDHVEQSLTIGPALLVRAPIRGRRSGRRRARCRRRGGRGRR